MAAHALLLEIRLLTDRYHGTRDWPPSPFRVYQALIAGAYAGRWKAEPTSDKDAAFEWLERLEPPRIAAPSAEIGRSTTYYVPNNDLDSQGGDPRRVDKIKVAKEVTPRMVGEGPIMYAWPFDDGHEHAAAVCNLADRLHTLGRGIDPACARAEVLPWAIAEERLRAHGGAVLSPTASGHSDDPTCPTQGSLESLARRHKAQTERFEFSGREVLFRQPPKAVFRSVCYQRRVQRFVFELRSLDGAFRPAPQGAAVEVALCVRMQLAKRLSNAFPNLTVAELERCARVTPLPSIGHEQASRAIRRLLLELMPGCAVPTEDVAWAVAGQVLEPYTRVDSETGEVIETQLVPSSDERMLRHYGHGALSRRWRTVTPVSVPLEPVKNGPMNGSERVQRTGALARHIAQLVARAGFPTAGLIVHPQREPFDARGLRADRFRHADSTTGVLTHAELIFAEPVQGPVIIDPGGGGLGAFRPAEPASIVRSGEPDTRTRGHEQSAARSDSGSKVDVAQAKPRGRAKDPEPGPRILVPASQQRGEAARFRLLDPAPMKLTLQVADVLRLALMSKLGDRCPPVISGRDHAGPLRNDPEHAHAFYLPEDADGDGLLDHVLVYCRNGFNRAVRRAMDSLTKLWIAESSSQVSSVGHEWRIVLDMFADPDQLHECRLVGMSREWLSVTPYLKPRYDRTPPRDFATRVTSYEQQLAREWRTRFPGTPIPAIQAIHSDGEFVSAATPGVRPDAFVRTRSGRGGHQPDTFGGFFRLTFERPVPGPIALGKHAHFGMGLFERPH